MRILIAPSGFKESLGADETARAIETGVRRAIPGAKIRLLPLVDGGEGFTRGIVAAAGGTLEAVTVTGPVGTAVDAGIGFLPARVGGPRTAVLEMAAAAGLRLVPAGHRHPGRTTTKGSVSSYAMRWSAAPHGC